MSVPKAVLRLLLVVPILGLVAACVESRHPLSDEKTSRMDDRLLGTWQLAPDSVWQVKKGADSPNGLEVEMRDANGTGRARLFTTTIKQEQYMSLADLDPARKKDPRQAWQICQYRFLDNDTVVVRGMEPDALRQAIAHGNLAGTAGKNRDPVITELPEGMTRYLEAHANKCYPSKTDLVLTFKRKK